MIRFSLSNLARFLIGILLVEGVTALLVVAALRGTPETWPLAAAVALLAGVLAASWFVSVANHAGRQALAKADEKFGKRQESARRRAERAKTKEVRAAEKRGAREAKRSRQQTNVKLGAALAGVSAISVGLLFTQFMTLGLLAAAAGGGALLGYRLRARQEAPRPLEVEGPEPVRRLPSPAQPPPPGPGSKQ